MDLPLAAKLTIFATVTSAASVTVVCALLGFYDASTTQRRLVSETARLLNGVGANSAATFLFLDDRVAADTARTVALDDQILTVAFLLPDGRVLARYDRRTSTGIAPAIPADRRAVADGREWHEAVGPTLRMTYPVRFDGRLVGSVFMERDESSLRASLNRLWWIVFYAWTGTTVTAALVGWRLQRIVSRPILDLANLAHQVVDRHDLSVRAIKAGDDEVGDLVDGFNGMLANIQRHERQLDGYRVDLERMVERRTVELNAKNERYRVLLESTRAVPWEIDAATLTVSYIAPQITRMSGHDPQNLVGRAALDLVHPLLQTFVGQYGDCHVAVNGREAVDAFRAARESLQPYDLICMDIMMPEMDGQAALTAIRAIEKEGSVPWRDRVRVVMVTALSDLESVSASFKGLCDDYLCKPIDPAALRDRLMSLQLVA